MNLKIGDLDTISNTKIQKKQISCRKTGFLLGTPQKPAIIYLYEGLVTCIIYAQSNCVGTSCRDR